MKKSFQTEADTLSQRTLSCPTMMNQHYFFTFLALFLLAVQTTFACDVHLSVKNNSLLFSLESPSGNPADIYTWTMTGDITASGSAGTGTVPLVAEIPLTDNTVSTFTLKLNGTPCFSRRVRIKYWCESPAFKMTLVPQECTVKFEPYGNPSSIIFHAWSFGDGTSESNEAYTSHIYADPGGVFVAKHTTITWSGIEYAVDRCVKTVDLDCTQIINPPVSGSDEAVRETASLKVAPNPVVDFVQVSAIDFLSLPSRVRWYSVTGGLMKEEMWPVNQESAGLYIGDFTAGHYVMELVCEDGFRKSLQVIKL